MDIHAKSLFSRQIGAIGKNSMERLMNTNVMLIGINQIAIEFVKCVSLLGIKRLVIVNANNTLIKNNNVTTHFHTVGDGKNKVKNIIDFAKTLNPGLCCAEIKLNLNYLNPNL